MWLCVKSMAKARRGSEEAGDLVSSVVLEIFESADEPWKSC